MFISVIPLEKSLSRHPYTYFVSETWREQIVVGGLIEVPLGKNIVEAIIFECNIEPPKEIEITDIRPIHSVLSSTPLIKKSMLIRALEIANKYYLLAHKALSLFLPAPLLSRLRKRHFVLETQKPIETTTKAETQIHHYIDQTFSPENLETYMLPGTIIVFPDDIMLSVFMKQWGEKHENILILRNESSPTKRSQAWIDIYEGKYSIIVGTRRILYYNLAQYRRIIYIEDAFGTKQFQYPIGIRSLDILHGILLAGTHDMTIISSSPTLELLSLFSGAKRETLRYHPSPK